MPADAIAGIDADARSGDVVAYEERLNKDSRWALAEGSRHFDEKSSVFLALHKIVRRLDELEIPYAVVGGLALFQHGFRRFTEDVDLLVAPDSLKRIHEELEGLGYLPPHSKSKHLRDTEFGVRIEFLVTGQYPGDGKPKPVAFPEPSQVSVDVDSVKYVRLETLVELKIASGMSSVGRMRDLSDVIDLVRAINLPESFAEHLHPFVREKFVELWRQARLRFVTVWRNRRLTADAISIDEMARRLADAARQLEQMGRDGVIVEKDGIADDYALLVTTDPDVAKKYGMLEEKEYWDRLEADDDSTAGDAAKP